MSIKKYRIQILSFLIPFLIMLSIFVIRGIYPFGDRSFLFSDMYHQYMPFFSEFMRKIKAGESLAYSYNVGIGSNFLALYVYYLASPLHWLAFLMPQAYLVDFMSYLTIVKIGLCGLTFCIWLREHSGGKQEAGMLVFSCFYALSGFMAAYNWNIMWLDCVILFPMILLGLERLVKEGKCTLYCLTLGLSVLTNYYISIMICLFLILYFVVLFCTEKRNFRMVRDFILYSVLAAGMASALLIPEVCAILETDFGDMDFPEKLESYFSVLDVLYRHCMCVAAERGLDHWPNIYCGVVSLMLVPGYALNRRIPVRKRFGNLALAGLLLLAFSTNVLDFIWHGMNYPDSLPARQSFLYIFLVLTMGYDGFCHMKEQEGESVIKMYLLAAVFLLFAEKFAVTDHFDTWVEVLNLGVLTAYAVLLYLLCTGREERKRQMLLIAIVFLAAAESGINMMATSVGTVSRSEYLRELPDYQALYEIAKEDAEAENGQEKPAFFRLEKFMRKTKNDGTLAGYPTASVFSSTMNSYVMDMYERLGMRHSKVYYGYDGATFFSSALLNVQYMYGESGEEEGPFYRYMAKSGEVSLYEVMQSLPFGYTAPEGFDLPQEETENGLLLQNRMVKELGVDGVLFSPAAEEQSGNDVTFFADTDSYYYGVVTASGTRETDILVNGDERYYKDLKKGSVLYLGYLSEGDFVTIRNADEEDESPKVSVEVYRMNGEVLESALSVLREERLTDVVFDTTHIAGNVSLQKNSRLILSVPYEKGWTVLMDGKKTEAALFGGALMAFDLEEGNHSISLSYTPYGRTAGILVSLFCVVVFTAVTVWTHAAGKKKSSHCVSE